MSVKSGSRLSPVPMRQPSMRPGWYWIFFRPCRMTWTRWAKLATARAAVPALKVPDHLNPGQAGVIPPPRPRPRPPRPALITARPAGRRLPAALILRRRRLRPRPLRRITEHHPLQDRQRSAHPLKLSRLPGVLLPQPLVIREQRSGGPLPPLVRLQRRVQGSPQRRHISIRTRRDRHPAQQTLSPAANHAPHASVSPHTRP